MRGKFGVARSFAMKASQIMADAGVLVLGWPKVLAPREPISMAMIRPLRKDTAVQTQIFRPFFGYNARVHRARSHPHPQYPFVHNHTHINGIENFWNQAKRVLRKYNGIPKASFPLFLKECQFRVNFGSPAQQLSTLKH